MKDDFKFNLNFYLKPTLERITPLLTISSTLLTLTRACRRSGIGINMNVFSFLTLSSRYNIIII